MSDSNEMTVYHKIQIVEYWEKTMNLRFVKNTFTSGCLQQQHRSSTTGETKWVKVEVLDFRGLDSEGY